MSLLTLLIVIAVFIAILFAINAPFVKQLIVKFKGRTEEVMGNDASTPEGAKDYYNAAIQEKEKLKNQAVATYAEIEGKLDSCKKDLYTAQKDVMRYTQSIDACVAENNDDDAMTYAMKKSTAEKKIALLKENIKSLEEARDHQKELVGTLKKDVQALKEEKEQVVYQLESDTQVIKAQQSIMNTSVDNESERMLEKVREGAKKKREQAAGSRAIYNESTEAEDSRLAQAETEREARRLVEEAKAKRAQKRY